MSKKKKPSRGPNLSPLSLLRPRLDGLFKNPGWAERAASAIYADLATITKDLATEDYLPILLKAVNDTEVPTRDRLAELLPAWLQQMNGVDALTALITQGNLPIQEREMAALWLQQWGVEAVVPMSDHAANFHAAYYGADELDSQGFLYIFWYTNRQQTRVRGMGFLIDFNPPWDGAMKDTLLFPQRSLQEAHRQFVAIWDAHDMPVNVEKVDAVTAKQRLITILERNRTQEIRLHQDLIGARDLFIKHILTLPDAPDTSLFSIADFDELSQLGQRSESIMQFEQTVGRWVRMEDGKKMLVSADMFEEE